MCFFSEKRVRVMHEESGACGEKSKGELGKEMAVAKKYNI
jgi:hypothetical protein